MGTLRLSTGAAKADDRTVEGDFSQGQTSEFVRDWERWRAARDKALNAPDGPPALVATYWLMHTDTVPGVPGTWSETDDGVRVVLPESVDALVGDICEHGEVAALAPGEILGPRLRFGATTAQVVKRQGQTGVRVFDRSRGRRLQGLGTFPPDPFFHLDGRYEPGSNASGVTYSFALEGAPRAVEVPGSVHFSLDGRDLVVEPLLDDGSLLLVFADRTTGTTTRPPGRFLLMAPPSDGLARPGKVSLDFNRAYLPPCAFSDEFNCPLPPSHHRFDVAVTAGETWAQLADPAPAR
jgi:uncharacterized protein